MACALVASLFASLMPVQMGFAEGIDPINPNEGRFMDDWAIIYLMGNKVGYMHSTMARDGDVINSSNEMVMRLGRVDQPVTLKINDSASETLLGKLLSFESLQDLSVQQIAIRGVVKNGKVTIETSQFGVKQSQVFDYDAGALFKSWGAFRESLIRGFEPGTEYTLSIYEPSLRMDAPIKAVTKIGDWESIVLGKRQVRGQRVTVTMVTPAGEMVMTSWVDEHGIAIKALIPAPGLGNMEIMATDQASALADFVPPEVFMTTVIKANRTIDPSKTLAIKYRLKSKNPDIPLASLPNTGMQKIISKSKDSVELVVTRLPRRSKGNFVAERNESQELKEYLASNLMISTKDKALIELANKAAGADNKRVDDSKPFVLADKLRRFVGTYINNKSLNVGFATASEVCRTREGDCSEHGVLLAALGRINGLPSRVAVGIAYVPYFGGQRDIFGYHMWTQFYIEGKWYDYDAALGESDCSPIRITFATSSLKNAGPADLSLPLLGMIGNLDLDIIEVIPMAKDRD